MRLRSRPGPAGRSRAWGGIAQLLSRAPSPPAHAVEPGPATHSGFMGSGCPADRDLLDSGAHRPRPGGVGRLAASPSGAPRGTGRHVLRCAARRAQRACRTGRPATHGTEEMHHAPFDNAPDPVHAAPPASLRRRCRRSARLGGLLRPAAPQPSGGRPRHGGRRCAHGLRFRRRRRHPLRLLDRDRLLHRDRRDRRRCGRHRLGPRVPRGQRLQHAPVGRHLERHHRRQAGDSLGRLPRGRHHRHHRRRHLRVHRRRPDRFPRRERRQPVDHQRQDRQVRRRLHRRSARRR